MASNQIQPTIGTGAVGNTTAVGFSERLVPELWAKEIADNRVDNLVLWQLIDSRYSSEIANRGDILHIPFVGEVDASFATNFTAGSSWVMGAPVVGMSKSDGTSSNSMAPGKWTNQFGMYRFSKNNKFNSELLWSNLYRITLNTTSVLFIRCSNR